MHSTFRSLPIALLLCSLTTFAANPEIESELRAIQSTLSRIQQEQQSVYQQFQMVQELRRAELQDAAPQVLQNSPVYATDNPPPNYDDVVKQKADRDNRIKQYTDQISQLFSQYQSYEQQKRMLVERERALMLQK